MTTLQASLSAQKNTSNGPTMHGFYQKVKFPIVSEIKKKKLYIF